MYLRVVLPVAMAALTADWMVLYVALLPTV